MEDRTYESLEELVEDFINEDEPRKDKKEVLMDLAIEFQFQECPDVLFRRKFVARERFSAYIERNINSIRNAVPEELPNKLLSCMEDYPAGELFLCSKNHGICEYCIKGVCSELENGTLEIGCPSMDPCDGIIQLKELRRYNNVLYEKALRMWIEEGEDFIPCPNTNCRAKGVRISRYKNEKVIKCFCGTEICLYCTKEAHPDVSCFELYRKSQGKISPQERENYLLSEAIIRKCPKCRRQIEKVTGCNRIGYPCGVHFCYLCEVDTTSVMYGHFKKGKCDVSEGVEENNKERIERALKILKDEKAAKEEMYLNEMMKKPYYKRYGILPPKEILLKERN